MASTELGPRALQAGTYCFDDLVEGDRWSTDGILVTDWHILTFAGVSGDFFAPHLDDAAAQEAGFERRIAHGLLVLALVDGLKNRSAVRLAAVASLGWTWEFRRPVHPGDRIAAEIAVAGLRATRRAERGLARLAFRVLNQDGQLVQEGENRLLLERRPV